MVGEIVDSVDQKSGNMHNVTLISVPERHIWFETPSYGIIHTFAGCAESINKFGTKSYDITNVSLPFQIIEHVDEPREEKKVEIQGNLFDERGRQLKGWTNKLIWGNNSLILSSLINGPLRQGIEKQGGLNLVYIDPPFDVGDDFEFDIDIGNETLSKKRNALEQLAFSDTWGKGEDSF